MDKGGGIEGVAGILGRHAHGDKLPQLVVDEREHVGGGLAVPGRGRFEKAGHIGHAGDSMPKPNRLLLLRWLWGGVVYFARSAAALLCHFFSADLAVARAASSSFFHFAISSFLPQAS